MLCIHLNYALLSIENTYFDCIFPNYILLKTQIKHYNKLRKRRFHGVLRLF